VTFKRRFVREVLAASLVLATALAVTNVAVACQNESLRLELRSAQLPDCRAYELVTPPFKAGTAVASPLISTDGLRLIAGGLGLFAGAEENTAGAIGTEAGAGAFYEFVRGSNGWLTTPVVPPPLADFPVGGMQGDASPDLGTSLWKLRTPLQPEGEGDLYRHEPGLGFIRLGPLQPPGEPPRFGNEGSYLGASQTLSHVFIDKRPTQGRWPGDATTGEKSLYEYAAQDETEPKLVGVTNAGQLASNSEAQLISLCGTELGSGATNDTYNAISKTGAIVYFTALECGAPSVNELYARIDGTHTVALSEPTLPAGQCTGSCATAEHREGFFVGASEDGSKAFFTTEQPLLNGDKDTTNDLYMVEPEGAAVKRLIMVSEGDTAGAPAENDQTPGEGADVLGVARVAADGSHIYFVARGVLTHAANSLGAKAGPGADNLYVTDTTTGRTRFIALLSEEDGAIWRRRDLGKPVTVTPNGQILVLVTYADLTGEGAAIGKQVYKYDATSGSLTRVSIGQHSSLERLAPRIVVPTYEKGDFPSEAHSKLTMSNDGSYVFFESPDALTAHALDDQVVGCLAAQAGTCFFDVYAANVYEYHEGHVSLIVTGRPTALEGSLLGTDETGTDVFFTTVESVAGSDTDTQQDIYDARVGGGFSPGAAPLSCSGESCRGPLSGPPQLSMSASAAQTSDDDLTPPAGLVAKSDPKRMTRAQHLAALLRTCRAKTGKKRRRCEAAATRRYGSKVMPTKTNRKGK
jgi:hypothetical protein